MKLRPVPKEIIWGGQRLCELYGKKAPFEHLAESWELTVRKDGMSVIDSGELSGMTLEEYIASYPGVVGNALDTDDFPLLIKFIDAHDDLSVQVHPDDAYANEHEGEAGKTEMWYIAEAARGAELVYGVKEGTTYEYFCRLCDGGDLRPVLNRIKIHQGDVCFIPSGQVHAICRGALIAEIQQNSNITYRLYDYGRLQPDGSPRQLHIKEALNTVKFYTSDEIRALQFDGRPGRRTAWDGADVLCDCKYFRVSRTMLSCGERISLNIDRTSFVSLLFTSANGASVLCGKQVATVSAGDSIFIPAGAGETVIYGKANVLISEI